MSRKKKPDDLTRRMGVPVRFVLTGPCGFSLLPGGLEKQVRNRPLAGVLTMNCERGRGIRS
jgi:hypothetical protein